MGPVGLELIEG